MRICEVDGRYGYFYRWEPHAKFIRGNPTKGTRSGRKITGVFAVIEFAEGIERVKATKVKFLDPTSFLIEPGDIVFIDVLTEDEIL